MRGPSESSAQPGAASPKTTDRDRTPTAATAAQYAAIQASPEFQELRSRYRRFVLPVTAGALAFYFAYVLLAAYAPGFMSQKVSGNVNVGIIFGLLQFVMVFAVTTFYVKFARRELDPRAEAIRTAHAQLDSEAGR